MVVWESSVNPASGSFIIDLNGDITAPVILHILNHFGQPVHVDELYFSGKPVETKDLPPGLYHIVIDDQGAQTTAKLVVSR